MKLTEKYPILNHLDEPKVLPGSKPTDTITFGVIKALVIFCVFIVFREVGEFFYYMIIFLVKLGVDITIDDTLNTALSTLCGSVLSCAALFICLYWFAADLIKKGDEYSIGFAKPSLFFVFLSLGLGVLLGYIHNHPYLLEEDFTGVFSEELNLLVFDPYIHLALNKGLPAFIYFVISCLIAPVAEEVLFRGILPAGVYRSLRKKWPVWVIITLLFLAAHIVFPVFYRPFYLSMVIFSIIAMVLRVSSKSIIPCMLFNCSWHIYVNLLILVKT